MSFFDNLSGFAGEVGGFAGQLAQSITQVGNAVQQVHHAWTPGIAGGQIVLPPTPAATSHPISSGGDGSPLILLGLAALGLYLVTRK